MQKQGLWWYSAVRYQAKRALGYAFPVMTTSIVGYVNAVDLLHHRQWVSTHGIKSAAGVIILLAKTVASTRGPSRCFLRAGLVL
jgi:hypothetical protein